MPEYKISGGEGAEEHEAKPRLVKRYVIKSNGPIDYEIPKEAEFYRIERDLGTDTFFLDFYEERCRNYSKVPYARENSGKAGFIIIRLKKMSTVHMEKRWIFT